MNTATSSPSTASAGVAIQNIIIEPKVDIEISKSNTPTTPTTSIITPRTRLSRTKSIQSHNINSSCSVRRSRFATFRSKSLDNDNIERNRHRRTLNKSKTLNYLSSSSRMIRNAGNGNGCCQNGGNNNNNKRIRLFDMNVDQSPLWTTLTHARTLSDFSAESWWKLIVFVLDLLSLY